MIRALTTLALLFAIAGCQIPQPPLSSQLVDFQLKAQGLPPQPAASGRTVLPGFPTYTFTVRLTLDADGTLTQFPGLTNPNPSLKIAEGAYHLQVTVYADGTGEVLGESALLSVTVNRLSANNTINVTVSPLTTGTGTLDVHYTWPTQRAGGTTISLNPSLALYHLPDWSSVSLGVGEVILDAANSLASVTKLLSPGTYYLVLQLSEGGSAHPPLGEVVQVWHSLTSSKTTAINLSQLNGPPLAPSAGTALYGAQGLQVSWTMDPSTQTGFRVYQNSSLVADITGAAQLNAVVPALPDSANDTIQVAAYNAFGESPRSSFAFSTLGAFTPEAGYGLRVEQAYTASAIYARLDLVWSNPQADTLDLYRALYPTGPYHLVASGLTGQAFQDDSVQPGQSYYYAFGAGENGYLIGYPSEDYSYGPGPYTAHLDPVAGVVSGTSLAWDTDLGAAVPVIGVPYLDPTDASDALVAARPATDWDNPELPGKALLIGGYTYWVWGKDLDDPNHASLAAFDSEGNFIGEFARFNAGNVTAFARSGANLSVTLDDGPHVIDWHDVAFSVSAAITVTLKQSPVITLAGGLKSINLSTASSDVVLITVELPAVTAGHDYQVTRWLVDGVNSGTGTPTMSWSSSVFTLGTHRVTVVIADLETNRVYSVDVPINVVR